VFSSYLSSVYFYCVYGCQILSTQSSRNSDRPTVILAGRSSRPPVNALFIVVVDGGPLGGTVQQPCCLLCSQFQPSGFIFVPWAVMGMAVDHGWWLLRIRLLLVEAGRRRRGPSCWACTDSRGCVSFYPSRSYASYTVPLDRH
jgi:hypothetical protein